MIVRPHSILLDSEALWALAAGRRTMQSWGIVARRTDSVLHACAITLAEVTDGTARDAQVRRVAKVVRVEPMTDLIGYRAGSLRARSAVRQHQPRALSHQASEHAGDRC
ncbi:MAG: hypothetical protein ACK5MT_08965 [Actinomycetales bacterium]